MSQKLHQVIEQIDEANAQDPHSTLHEGKPYPKELLYGQRMTQVLHGFVDRPSEALQIAARGQHIQRWSIPRSDYPMDRKGYLKWRTDLKIFHSKLVGDIMQNAGYSDADIQHVQDLLMKKRLKKDPEAQALEDVICLVFLQYYIDEFADDQEDEKMISILGKTWTKMSEKGHQAALNLPLSDKTKSLVTAALNG